jgi:hypothetical protein
MFYQQYVYGLKNLNASFLNSMHFILRVYCEGIVFSYTSVSRIFFFAI